MNRIRRSICWPVLLAIAILVPVTSASPAGAQGTVGSMTIPDFVRIIYTDVTTTWDTLFTNSTAGLTYTAPHWYTLDTGFKTESLCPGDDLNSHVWLGDPNEETQLSPAFYCPVGGGFLDNQTLTTPIVYLSTPFLDRLGNQVDPDNHDFAIASVVAHEIAHDVQFQLGYIIVVDGIPQYRADLDSRQLELSADCLGGVWANAAYYAGELTDTDVEEAQAAALLSGSDFPEPAGTNGDHGTGVDRYNYWSTGYNTGNPAQCEPGNINP